MTSLISTLVLVSTVVGGPGCEPPTSLTRSMTIEITVTAANVPMADVGISVFAGCPDCESAYGRTDATGHASIVIIGPQNTAKVSARIDIVGLSAGLSTTARRQASADSLRLIRDFTFKEKYWINVAEPAASYSLSIDVQPARHIRLKPTYGGQPLDRNEEVSIVHPGSLFAVRWEADGTVDLGGLTIGQPTFCFVCCQNSVSPVALPASPDALDLGEVPVLQPVNNATALLTLSSRPAKFDDREVKVEGITLMSTDGTYMMTYLIRDGKAINDYSAEPPVNIPAGTYYLAPGLFGATELQVKLFKAIRAANGTPLPGLTPLTIAPGVTVTHDLNIEQTLAAMRALPEPAP